MVNRFGWRVRTCSRVPTYILPTDLETNQGALEYMGFFLGGGLVLGLGPDMLAQPSKWNFMGGCVVFVLTNA